MLPLGLGKTIFDPHFNISAMQPVMQNLAENSMDILGELNAHRSYIASIYINAFNNGSFIPVPEGRNAVYTRFPLMATPDPIPKDLKRLGVRRMYPKAIADEKTIKPYLVDQEVYTPGASKIAQNLITLPTHKGITENMAKEIARKVNDIRIKETRSN